jgi:hypothetical protein
MSGLAIALKEPHVSRRPGQTSSLASQLRELRLKGQLGPALQLASQAVTQHADDGEAMVEAVCVLVCLGEGQPAAQLYQAMTADQVQENSLAPEVLVRLALLLGRRDLLEEMKPPAQPPWLVEVLTSGTDPTAILTVTEVHIRGDYGHSVFTMTGACPHCGQTLARDFRTSLLVHVEWICPACFGLVGLDAMATRAALNKLWKGDDQAGLRRWDRDLIDHLRPVLTGAEPRPFMVQALAQEYHFLLNELILKFVAGRPDPESSP